MQFVVTAGPHRIDNLPVSVELDKQAQDVKLSRDGKIVAAQTEQVEGKTVVHWVVDKLDAGAEKVYEVELTGGEKPKGVDITDIGDGKLEVKIGGEMFTRYHYGSQFPRPFLYPVIGPDKTPVTRNFPMIQDIPEENKDHKHHRSIYVAYGDVNGTDNWSEEPGHATILETSHEVVSGPVLGRIMGKNDWLSSDGKKQMEDERVFTFYDVPGDERIIDVSLVFKATVGDVLLGDTKEGGIISVRVATTMDGNKSGTIVNAYGGITERECWGKPAHWVDYYGLAQGKTMGVTIMDHPDSFRYPTRWHVRDYGLFTANPFALHDYEPHRGWRGDHTIKNGDSLNFRYRIYVHKGDTESADVGNRFLGFIYPPKIEVKG